MTAFDASSEMLQAYLPNRPLFTEYIHHRMNGLEEHRPLLDKVEVAEFAKRLGVRSAKILKIFDRADQIFESGLPDRCVVKPSNWWSMKGVMLLQKSGDTARNGKNVSYREFLTGRNIDLPRIVEEQDRHQKESLKRKPNGNPKIILEEFVVDEAGPHVVPLDYKMYCFNGEVRFIVQMNRNASPPQVAFYRDEFVPIKFDQYMEPELNWCRLGSHRIPKCWYEMLELGKKASHALATPFISVDTYASASGPVMGELTPTPGGPYFGMWRFRPFFNEKLGDAWTQAKTILNQQGRHFVPISKSNAYALDDRGIQ